MSRSRSASPGKKAASRPTGAREGTGPPGRPSSFGARAAALMAAAYDGNAAVDALLDEVESWLDGSAWLAVERADGQSIAWLPEDRRPSLPRIDGGDESASVAQVLRTGRERLLPEAPAPDQEAWVLLPIHAGEMPIACLVIRAKTAERLDGPALGTLREAAPIIALALKAHTLQRELEARIEEVTREVSLLYDVSRSLGLVNSPGALFDLLGTSLRRTIGYDLCALTLESAGRLQMAVQPAGLVEPGALAAFERLALHEMVRHTGVALERTSTTARPLEPGEDALPIGEGDLRSVLHAPIVVRGRVVGLLSLASREAGVFREEKTRLLYTIANQASLTVDRLRRTREAEASRIHSMLESMTEGVLLLDRELRVVMSNPAAQAQLAQLLPGAPVERISTLGDVDLARQLESFGEGESLSRTFEVPVRREGRLFSITCSPVHEQSEEPQGLVVVISDITEARIRQIQMAQNEKLSALGEMISGVAHELNNPLASVMMHAQLLRGREGDKDTREKLNTIDAEATRCRRIVQNLLRFARTQSPERRPLDINSALDSVFQLLGHQLKVDDIDLVTDLEPALRPVVGDSHLLQQVFVNIIFNAYQAMKERGGPGRLTVRTRNARDRVLIEIADTGPGIAAENLERIFDPFFSTKDVGKGTGLGLSLAYGTVREHGGGIAAANAPGGRGAIFTVEFPAAEEGTATMAAQEGASAGIVEPAAAEEAMSLEPSASTGKRILVVEDEAPLAAVVSEVLATLGHSVDTAGDGRTAKDRIARVQYDAIISDMKMPNMNGREFYRHVAAVQPALARRIIFSTGDTASPETQAFFEEVGNPYLSKPFNIRDLIRIVESVLGAA